MDPVFLVSQFMSIVLGLPIEWQTHVLSALVGLGALTVLVAPLKALAPMMQKWALSTETKVDDALTGAFSDVVGILAELVDIAKLCLEYLALHRIPKLPKGGGK